MTTIVFGTSLSLSMMVYVLTQTPDRPMSSVRRFNRVSFVGADKHLTEM